MNTNTHQPPTDILRALLDEASREGHLKMIVGGLRRELGSENAAMDLHVYDYERTLLTIVTIDFDGLLEFSLDQEITEHLEIAAPDHPILWPHVENHAELYFYSATKDPRQLIADLHEAHSLAVLKWFPLDRFTNDLQPLHKLLAAANGCLAAGPLPLIRVYEGVLQAAAIQCSILESKHPRGRSSNLDTSAPVALLMGTSYFIARRLSKVHARSAERKP